MDSVFGVVGVTLSNALYFNTIPKMRAIFQEQSVSNFNPMPIMVMLLNAVAWVLYGIHVEDRAVVASNGPGGLLCAWYVWKLMPIIEDAADRRLCQIVLASGFLLLAGEQVGLRLMDVDTEVALYLEGLTATFYCVAMFAAPLSQIRKVVASRDASSIYWPLTTVQVANCLTWTVYGLAKEDVWIYGPNLAGLCLAFVQVGLLLAFGGCRGKPTLLPMEVVPSPRTSTI